MLNSYLSLTQSLLQNPGSSAPYATADLTNYVNIARGQLAGESESIRVLGTLMLTIDTQVYNFSSISLSSAPAGVSGVFKINQAQYQVASGYANIRPRPFQWFMYYILGQPTPVGSTPKEWTQYGQGSTGSIYLNIPDQPYVLQLDCVCIPENLASDSTPEAIPYPWTDAVPYFAAYLAYQSAQRKGDAEKMFELYKLFVDRARKFSNPMTTANIYSQATDLTLVNKLAIQPPQGGGG